jgi:hypothetical protein
LDNRSRVDGAIGDRRVLREAATEGYRSGYRNAIGVVFARTRGNRSAGNRQLI